MKVEIREDEFIHVTAETVVEAIALKYLCEKDTKEGQPSNVPIVVDCKILDNPE